ncbi:hypothetical protein ROZALSC1DRAFT_25898, partial [Rozella allomycis CSF55]
NDGKQVAAGINIHGDVVAENQSYNQYEDYYEQPKIANHAKGLENERMNWEPLYKSIIDRIIQYSTIREQKRVGYIQLFSNIFSPLSSPHFSPKLQNGHNLFKNTAASPYTTAGALQVHN